MRNNQMIGAVIFAIACTLAWKGFPIEAAVLLFIPIMAGTTAVFFVRNMVVAHCQCSQKLGDSITVTIIESLVSADEGTRLPSTVAAGNCRQFLGDLYGTPQFKAASEVVKALGPVPCYPACAWLSRQHQTR